MDANTLRFTYLNYFKNQLDKNEPIDTKVLMDMAQNINNAAEVIKELKDEGLIEGISIIENDPNHVLMQSNHNVKLTEKGIRYLESKDNNTDKVKENLTYEQFMSNEIDRINKLSTGEKKDEIKNKILLEYYLINDGLPIYDDNEIEESELKQKIRNIVKNYYPSTPQIIAKQITKDICMQGYSSYVYSKNEDNKIPIADLLTKKGKEKVEEVYGKLLNKTLGELTNKDFYILYGKPCFSNLANIKVQPIFKELNQKINSLYGPDFKKIQQVLNNYPLKDNQHIKELQKYIQRINNAPLAKEYYNIQKQFGNIQQSPELQKIQKSLSELMKEPPSNLYNELTKEPENTIESDADKYTFEGILGRNCGTITRYYGSEPRLLEKGYIVEEGTCVLRGYAKMSDLVGASIVDKNNYQRIEDIQHVKDIKDFLQKGKVHFLPEVVLVARNEVEIQEIDFNLKGKQLGRFKNINYRKIIVAPKSLYRVDGNHRLEAYEESQKDYYIPFSIILWHLDEELEESQEQQEKQKKNDIDNEAFLFYLLNAKSKPLTLEDNIKGIVKSDVNVWKDENIRDVNFIFPHLREIYNDLNNDSLFKKYHYIDNKGNSNVWTQYLSILNRIFIEENKDKKIEEEYTISFDKGQCKEMVCKTILLLSQTTRFKYLREHYNKFPQLVFYLHYLKFLDTKNEIDIENDLEDINTWAEKYKHDDNSFENPINMYKNALKQIQRGEINIFVAMPYYSKDCIKQFNLNYEKIIKEIAKKNPRLKNRLNLFPIMEHTGETKNILNYIDDCIDKCQIFIADVSDDPAKNNIVNPNVMYELGVARQKGKPCIIIRNADNNTELIFDIKPMSVYLLNFENPDVNFVPEMTTHIEEIIEKYYIS